MAFGRAEAFQLKQKKVKNDCNMSMISGKISGQSLSDDVNVLNEVIKKKSMLAPHFMSLARHAYIFLFFFFNRATKFA